MKYNFLETENVNINEVENFISKNKKSLYEKSNTINLDMLGWRDINNIIDEKTKENIIELSKEIRKNAKYFVVIGIGGSNQGARAVIDLLQKENDSIEIIYAGTNLSAKSLKRIFNKLKGKSFYINVIAKNFQTLEPGITFKLFREFMKTQYSEEEMQKRIITTVTIGDEKLHKLSLENNYRFLPFPKDIAGRFSVFSAVGLLPIAAAGINIEKLLHGAVKIYLDTKSDGKINNYALEYALTRYYLLKKGYVIENFSFFESEIYSFAKWWRQLFGETEGKNLEGLFPAICSYTEDLHSMGQYIQDGKRVIIESFLTIKNPEIDININTNDIEDDFEYLNGKTLNYINNSVYLATLYSHRDGEVPCFTFEIDSINEKSVGSLLYFFMMSCYYSALLLNVDPFDQPGVESYKNKMNKILKG